jgi:poly(beta-D-mannuronate) lyase
MFLRLTAVHTVTALAMACGGAEGPATPGAPSGGAPGDLPAAARTRTAASLAELQQRINEAQPGDRIVLANGTHTGNAAINVGRSGTPEQPIVIAAETIGGVTLAGAAGFSFSNAAHVVVHGFRFTHGSTQRVPTGSRHIRIARNVFQLAPSVTHWLDVAGDDCEIDHNTFQNKSTEGVYLSLVGPGSTGMAQRTRVHHNYFFNHTFSGSNGGESIRAGLSGRALSAAHSVIEYNLFEQANGDPEAISIKSSDNVIRYNTVRHSKGCLVFRHGNRTTLHGNFVMESGCGIRVYGNDHRIFNNYLANNTGAALTIGSGTEADHYDGEPSDTRTGYDASERVRFTHNTLVGNAVHVTGEDRDFVPREWVFANNLVSGDAGTHVNLSRDTPVNFAFEGNVLWTWERTSCPRRR